jgi:hypothetical protein
MIGRAYRPQHGLEMVGKLRMVARDLLLPDPLQEHD